jgi:hypothetical protein
MDPILVVDIPFWCYRLISFSYYGLSFKDPIWPTNKVFLVLRQVKVHFFETIWLFFFIVADFLSVDNFMAEVLFREMVFQGLHYKPNPS